MIKTMIYLINFLPEYYISENLLLNLISKNKGIKKFYAITPKIAEGDNFKKIVKKNRITNNNLNKYLLNNIKQNVIYI